MRIPRRAPLVALLLVAGCTLAQNQLFQTRPTLPIDTRNADSLGFTSDGRLFLTVDGPRITLIDTTSGAVTALPQGSRPFLSAAIARDGSLVAAVDSERRLSWWSAASPAWRQPSGISRRARSPVVAISADALLTATPGHDRSVAIWDSASTSLRQSIPLDTSGNLVFLGFRGLDSTLIGLTEDGRIYEWDVKNGRLLRQLGNPASGTLAAALSFDGALLAIADESTGLSKGSLMRSAHPADFHRENQIRIYDLDRATVVKIITGIDGEVRAVSFSADGRFIAALRQKPRTTFFSVFDVARASEIQTTPAAANSRAVAFSPDGRWLAGPAPDGRVQLLQVAGVSRSANAGDLAGTRIMITSRDRSPLISSAQPSSIAVMDFQGLNVSADTARAVSAMIRTRIAEAGKVTLIERERIDRLMREQNFQFSDRVDPATAVSFGKILNCRKLLFGSVSQLGTSITIAAQLIDVESAKTDGIREVLCQRCALDDLPLAVAELRSSIVE